MSNIHEKEGLATTVHGVLSKYGRNSDIISSTVKRLIKKLRDTGPSSDIRYSGLPSRNCLTENSEPVRESVCENSWTSIQHRNQKVCNSVFVLKLAPSSSNDSSTEAYWPRTLKKIR